MLWHALLLFGGAKCLVLDNPTIAPDFINALANSSFELTCYTRQNASFTQWGTVKKRDKFSLLYYSREGSCTPEGFLDDSQYFETSCYSNGTFKVKIKQVNISYHGQRWYCSYGYGSSNFANITVRVPADHVTIEISSNKNIYIMENEMQTVSCNTSACFPKPRVKWYLKNPTNNLTKYLTDHTSQSYFFRKDGLISAESILQVLLNRTVNSWHLYCEVWTRTKYADISSRTILLNVAYPPDGPPIIVDNEIGKTVQVIEAESVNLNCTITGGNPLAILRINCFNSSSTTMISTETTVSVYIVWKAIRYLNKCKCESDHIIGGTQITTVRFDVRFPPSIVYFSKLGIKSKRGTFAVERNEEVTIECLAESNPLPDIMLTNQRDEQVAIVENATFLQYSIFKVSCTDAGEYKCSAKNVLTTEHVILSNLIIIVKCPPRPSIHNFNQRNITAQLNSDVTLLFLAQSYFDEQNKTVFSWHRKNMSLQNNGSKYIISSFGSQSNLIIRNISQSDYGQYNVLVRNSIGYYRHYYELQRNVPYKTAKEQSTDPTSIWTLIYVSVGTFFGTILAVVLAFICNRYIRRKEIPKQNNLQKTVSIPDSQQAYNLGEYDEIHVYEHVDEHQESACTEMQNIKADDDPNRDYISPTL